MRDAMIALLFWCSLITLFHIVGGLFRTADAAELDLVVYGASYHTDRDAYDWNEVHPGAGLEVRSEGTLSVHGGVGLVKNSYADWMDYVNAGVGVQVHSYIEMGVDLYMNLFNGYTKEQVPAAPVYGGPYAEVGGDRLRLRVHAVPPKGDTSGVITFQLHIGVN